MTIVNFEIEVLFSTLSGKFCIGVPLSNQFINLIFLVTIRTWKIFGRQRFAAHDETSSLIPGNNTILKHTIRKLTIQKKYLL